MGIPRVPMWAIPRPTRTCRSDVWQGSLGGPQNLDLEFVSKQRSQNDIPNLVRQTSGFGDKCQKAHGRADASSQAIRGPIITLNL